MQSRSGVYGGESTLASDNDGGKSFAEIANIIEANVDDL
jgi:hypothetical protein